MLYTPGIFVNYNIPYGNTIRNFAKIICNKNYIKPEIAECIILPTGETIAILKTFWIRIIQKVYKIFNTMTRIY
jgi:hypothetical protein